MCGIAGRFNFERKEPVDRDVIGRMTDAIRHRGPDDEGYYVAGPVGLGFRRLSIIDLAGGHQPMSDEQGTVWVVFNGEIYNFPQLRSELERLGHRFSTRSDTEVLIYGYKEWDTGVFDRLNGMFGLAIWDARRQRLVVARDAMGIKLVYYRNESGNLTFGSEIRAVVAAQASLPDIDPVSLEQFLSFRYTPSPRTLLRGVQKLAPGMMLVVENGTCRKERWYNHTPVPFQGPFDYDELTAELLGLYRDAVQRHLLSDVPVGILLSGGLDSGLLLALMNEHGRSWPAFTVGYGETFKDDELATAAESARLLGARHVPVQIDRRAFEDALPSIVACLEEPVTSSSVVPMYFVCQRAREDVKVALVGQGPDELLCGYKRHVGVHLGGAWRALPRSVRNVIGAAIGLLPRNETAKRGVHALGVEGRLERYREVFALTPSGKIRGLFNDGLLPRGSHPEVPESWLTLLPQMQHLDELGGFQLLEVRSSLPDELLMFSDKLSMAHGLEVRVPYLDRAVVEFCQRLPVDAKIRHRTGKWLHRQVCRRFLPETILKRRKRGFAVNVVDQWFNASIRGTLPELLLDSGSLMFNLLEPSRVRQLLDEHRSGREDNHKLLFSLVMLEQWLRHVQQSGAGEPRPC